MNVRKLVAALATGLVLLGVTAPPALAHRYSTCAQYTTYQWDGTHRWKTSYLWTQQDGYYYIKWHRHARYEWMGWRYGFRWSSKYAAGTPCGKVPGAPPYSVAA